MLVAARNYSFISCVVISILLTLNISHADDLAITADGSCIDTDGDGYGWDGTKTCIPLACVDSDGDGWGWDGFRSCRVSMPCVDSDGDGYGWDGFKTCLLTCEDPDGDGYGWDGTQTCLIDYSIGIPEGESGFSEGVVTAANPIAAAAGAKVLEDGGNAIDAAAVVQFVLNVVEPTSSGIGGGGFMGVHLADTGRTFFIDSRERAPQAATPTQYLDCDPNCTGAESRDNVLGGFTDIATSGLGVGVPGTLLGVSRALEQYGTISLSDALQPAISLAENGFEINDRLASLTESSRTTFWPETSSKFRTPEGEPLAPGFLLVQPDLAKTFRLIAENGVEVFYTGEIADAIVDAQTRYRDTVGEQGAGRMTKDDLAAYLSLNVNERAPILADYRGYTMKGMPPPSSGGLTVAQILECLEQFPLGDEGYGLGDANTLHVMVESMRLAFSSRSVWMGDTDFVDLPVAGLTNADYLATRCAQIDIESRIEADAIEPGDPRQFDPAFNTESANVTSAPEGPVGVDTTHFTVIDNNGNVVSWTSTIEGTWGSGITVPGYGFLLNNELTDFNFIPQANNDADDFKPGANDVAPGKRPRSSMAPTFLFHKDDLVAAYGSPGGSTIINSVVNITVNLVDHGLSLQDAIDAPRISSSGGSVAFESAFSQESLDALEVLGHTLRDSPSVIGSVQAIAVDLGDGTQYGGADSRRAGSVQGLPRF